MYENLIANLTSKDDKFACAIADKIISESQFVKYVHVGLVENGSLDLSSTSLILFGTVKIYFFYINIVMIGERRKCIVLCILT